MSVSRRVTSRALGKASLPPAFLSLTINAAGDTLTGVATQDLTSADFTVGVSLIADDLPVAINSGSVLGNIVTWGIDTVLQDQVCVLAYDAGVGDMAGTAKPLASFSMPVTNNSTQTGGGPACVYPFDASQATVQGFSFADRLALSNGDQSFTYTVQSGLGAPQAWGAFPSALGSLDVSTGVTALEWVLDNEPTFSGGSASALATQSLIFYTGGFSQELAVNVAYWGDGTKHVGISIGGSSVYIGTPTVTRFGIEFNAGDSTIHIKVDGGTELTLSSNAYTPQALTPLAQTSEVNGLSGSYLGQLIGSSFVSDAANYAYTYDVGATDLCGNAA